jgi:hypothetical protein
MERGLLWLPVLIGFIWLAWSGWREYQKVEAYQAWAKDFDHAKYDIYAVLGLKGDVVTHGQPSRLGPINLQSFSLTGVREITLTVDQKTIAPADLADPPPKGRTIELVFSLPNGTVKIPFTEVALAAKWCQFFQSRLKNQSEEVNC